MNARNLPGWLVALLLILAWPGSARLGVELERVDVHGVEVADVADSSMRAAAATPALGGREGLPPFPGPLPPCEHEGASCAVEQGGGESLEEHGAGYEVLRLGRVLPVDPFFDFSSHVLSMAYFPALLRPPIA